MEIYRETPNSIKYIIVDYFFSFSYKKLCILRSMGQ